jgi:hypothetical protein
MEENNQESGGQIKEVNKPKFSLQDVVSTNTIIDCSLNLLSQVNFEIVDFLLDSTPPEMRGLSYKVLQLTKKFNSEMQDLFSKQNKEENNE